MIDYNIRQLCAAVIMQAVDEYMKATTNNKKAILKDLRSKWMRFFSDDLSVRIAEQLELHPDEIRERMKGMWRNGVNQHW